MALFQAAIMGKKEGKGESFKHAPFLPSHQEKLFPESRHV
jgi:hypothetical protein